MGGVQKNGSRRKDWVKDSIYLFFPGEIIGSLGRYKSFILSHLLAAKNNDGGISGQQGHKTEDSQHKRAAS